MISMTEHESLLYIKIIVLNKLLNQKTTENTTFIFILNSRLKYHVL